MRKYEIDYLRVFAFMILILYHAGMVFVPWDYHLKNNAISEDFEIPMLFVNQWRLPLLFVISGIGTYFSFSRRSNGQFARERFRRLIVPLIFGILVIVPPQIYYERLVQGVPYLSYLDFYLNDAVRGGAYPLGNFSWHHLWFILYLFIFSALLVLLKKPLNLLAACINKYKLSAKAWLIFLMVCIPTFLCEYILRPYFPTTHALANDWYTIASYIWLFFCGYLFAVNMKTSWPIFTKAKYIALCGGIIAFIYLSFPIYNGGYILYAAIRTVNMWCWLFAIIGFGVCFLTKGSKWLSYANEAVYPFYILHQTVIVAITYYIYNLDMHILTKFLIVAAGTFTLCWMLYEFLIRRVGVLRFLFGMKPRLTKA